VNNPPLRPRYPGRACAARQAETLDELLEATTCPLQASDGTTCVSDCPHLRLVGSEVTRRGLRVETMRQSFNCAAPVKGGNAVVGVPVGNVLYRYTDGGVPLTPRKDAP